MASLGYMARPCLKKLTKERASPGAHTRKQAPETDFEEGAMSRIQVLGNMESSSRAEACARLRCISAKEI